MALTDLIPDTSRMATVRPTIRQEIRPARHARFAGAIWILIAAAMAATPVALHRSLIGDDLQFHLISWMDAQQSWRHGILYPHWAPSPNFGAGEARFVFYPPLTWMVGAALGLVVPWTMVPTILSFLLLAGVGLTTRALARQTLPAPAATLAGCVALFSGYALFTCYERAAYGELCAGIWIPLLMLFVLRDRLPAAPLGQRVLDGSALPLALAVAGVWLCDAPAGVMAAYLLAGVALLAAGLARSWFPIVRALLAFPIGMGLCAFYVLPAAWEQRWVDILQTIGVDGDPGLRIENNWIFARHSGGKLTVHEAELQVVSLLAVSMIAVALLSFLVIWQRGVPSKARGRADSGQLFRRRERSRQTPGDTSADSSTAIGAQNAPIAGQEESSLHLKSGNTGFGEHHTQERRVFQLAWIPFVAIAAAVLILLLPLSFPVWDHLPKLRFLQFPWRWLVVVEAPMACLLARAVWSSWRSGPWQSRAVAAFCALTFAATALFSASTFFRVGPPEDQLPSLIAAAQSGAGLVGTDEYAPPGADNSTVAMGLPDACLVDHFDDELGKAQDPETNPRWSAVQGSCYATAAATVRQPQTLRLNLTSARNGFLILRLRSYPAWRIQVNGRVVDKLPARGDGLMAVPVQRGPVDLSVHWIRTSDVLVGRGLSCMAAILLLGLGWLERRAARPIGASSGEPEVR